MKKSIYLRQATCLDMDLLFQWANDPIVRRNSFNMDLITYARHVEWFKQIMADDRILQYILMADDTPVGQVRLVIDGNEAEIGYSIDRKHRNCGFGHIALYLVEEEIKKEKSEIKRLIAKVKPENTPSNRLLESEGFDKCYYCYCKNMTED